jgi:hypothetical protein
MPPVGVSRGSDTCVGDSHAIEHGDGGVPCVGLVLLFVEADHFGNLLANGERRIERCHGLLEDVGNLGAAHRLECSAGQSNEFAPLQED